MTRALPQPIRQFLEATSQGNPSVHDVVEQRLRALNTADELYARFGRRSAVPTFRVTEHSVPVEGGSIRVRAYRPDGGSRLPVHVFLHGGAWWLGSIDEHVNEALCRYRCVHAVVVVVAVDYRLAPEHKYPTALHDVHDVLQWIVRHADLLDVDAANMSVGGVSAGANLAAAVTLLCRDNGGPELVFQMLEVPFLDLRPESVGNLAHPEELRPFRSETARLKMVIDRYLDKPEQASLALVSPMCADDLSCLPPAHIITAQLDPLRTQGEEYARLLAVAGTQSTLVRYRHAVHGTSFLTGVWQPAQDWELAAAAAVRQAHEHQRVLSGTETAPKG